MKIRTLIALARRRIRRYLKKDSEIEIIGECTNGQEAISAITELQPDLVFLDVQMPEKDGFNVLNSINESRQNLPTIIFVTAYDQFAIRAFEVNAFDYLLKPFSMERLEKTLARAKKQIYKQDILTADERLLDLLTGLKEETKFLKRIAVKEKGKIIFVPTDEIDFIEAQGNYLQLDMGKYSHLIRMRLHLLEQKLDASKFVRIHRSTIINIDRVKEMQPLFNGDQTVIMKSEKRLTMSRTYREKLKSLMEDF
jgi:two-component system, LytTR family, response regulator